MSKYVSQRTETIAFDGDNVTVVIEPVSYIDAQLIREKKIAEALPIIKTYVKAMNGLNDANGLPLTIDQVFGSYYFASFIVEVVKVLMLTGVMTPEEERPFDKR